MSLLDYSPLPQSPSALPAFTAPAVPSAAPRGKKPPAAKIIITPAVTVTAGVPAHAALTQAPSAPPATAAPKAAARKRTRKFTPDFLAKELPPRTAAAMDSFQLNAVLDTMFRLDAYAGDMEAVARLRAEHPNELVVAERMTGWHLGSVEEFKARAEARFFDSPASSIAFVPSRASIWSWALSLAAAPLVTGAATIAATGNGALGLAVGAVTALVGVVGSSRPEPSGVPELVDADWGHLRRDVVDASLAAVIKERNLPLDPQDEAALTRGFEHMHHVATAAGVLVGPSDRTRKPRHA